MKPTILIISGGSSARMYPLNNSRHKGLLPLGGQALIYRTIAEAYQKDFRKFVVVVNPNGDNQALEETLRSSFDQVDLTFITQENALGMGDAVLQAKDHLDETFIILAPYHFAALDAVEKLLATGSSAAICTAKTETPWRYGIAQTENSKAISIIEKPEKGSEPSNQKVQACYLLNQTFLSILEQTENSHYNFETALNELMQREDVTAVQLEESLPSLKYPWQLFKLQKEYFDSLSKTTIAESATVAETAVLDDSKGSIIIDENATVGDFAKIAGPAYIGKNVIVGDYAFIRQSSIEEKSVVGANTEIVRSIILEKSSIHFGYLADSILDQRVKIAAGLVTANKRLDRENIKVTIGENTTDSATNTLGIIAGEGAETGIKVGTMPGVILGPHSKVFPGVVVFSSVEENEVKK